MGRPATWAALLTLPAVLSACGLVGVVPLVAVVLVGTETVTSDDPRILTAGLPGGVAGSAYSFRLSALGGDEPYTWSVRGAPLPSGLTLDPATGEISGTPVQWGVFNPRIRVRDQDGREDDKTFSLDIAIPNLAITTTTLSDGDIGSSYSTALAASGGIPPYTWTVTAGAPPPGLVLDLAGTLSGTPTQADYYTFTAQVTDNRTPAGTDSRSLNLLIRSTAVSITTTALPKAVPGVPYAMDVEASGGLKPYAWSLAGTPPAWLAIDPHTGRLSGTPSAEGTANVDVEVRDATYPTPQTDTQTFTLDAKTIGILTTALPPARVGVSYTATPTAVGGSPPANWSLQGTPPSWLAIDGATGRLTGIPNAPGTPAVTVRVEDATNPVPNFDVETYALQVLPMEIASGTLDPAAVGVAYAFTPALEGGVAPVTWSLGGSPPAWLSINTATGELTGVPTATGAFGITLDVQDSASPTPNQASRPVTLVVGGVVITTTELPTGFANAAYNVSLTAAGGQNPLSWTLDSGTLPEGLTLSTAGLVSGIPVASVFRLVTVKVQDAGSPAAEHTRDLEIKIYAGGSAAFFGLGGTVNTPSLHVDGNDTLHWAWADNVTGNPEVYYSRQDGNGAFSWPLNLSLNPGNSTRPVVKSGPGGQRWVVWQDDSGGASDIRIREFAGGRWSDAVNLSASSDSSEEPDLAVAPDGTLAVVWQEFDSGNSAFHLWAAFQHDFGWTPPARCFPGDNTRMVSPTVDFDRAGTLHLSYLRSGSPNDVYWYARWTGGAWSTPQALFTPPETGVRAPDLAVDVPDFPCVFGAFNGAQPEGILRWRDTSGWNTSTPIPTGSGAIPGPIALCITARNHTAYSHRLGAPNTGLWVKTSLLGDHTSFTTQGFQFTGHYTPDIDSDSLENLYVAATDSGVLRLISLAGAPAFHHRINTGLRDGFRGAFYADILEAFGGITPYQYAVTSGSLPGGLILGGASGQVSGTPTAEGRYDFTVECTDSNGSGPSRSIVTEPRNIIVWTPSVSAENSAVHSEYPALAAASPSDAHLVWEENLGFGNWDIGYSHFNGATWSTPIFVSSSSGVPRSPHVAVDSAARLHVVWQDNATGNFEIHHRSYDGQNWSSPANLSSTMGLSQFPRMAIDGTDHLHVVWQDDSLGNEEVFYAKFDGTWTIPQNLSNSSADSTVPDVRAESHGRVYVVWQEDLSGSGDIFFTQFTGAWFAPRNVSRNAGASTSPRIARGTDGTYHVVWQDDTPGNSEVFYARYDLADWSTPRCLSQTTTDSRSPHVAAVGTTPHVYWQEDVGGLQRIFHTRFEDGAWRPLFELSATTNHCGFPTAAWAGQDKILVGWQELRGSNYDIRIRRN
ncbi:MAG: putative Ig domain-containing protein [Planctomycetota bacterium]|jgi:hypothetical protein